MTPPTTTELKPENPNHESSDSINSNIVSLKIPPFWNNRPDLWFIQVESQFRVKRITSSDTKYDYLVASLPQETMEIVADILKSPPAQDKYENLKAQLLQRSTDSESRRLDTLLHKVELGDYKPSELYRHMESLASSNSLVNLPLLKKLWINKLPPAIQACIIAIEESQPIEEVFKIADKIYDSTTISSVSVVNNQATSSLNQFTEAINSLTHRIKRLETRGRQNSTTFKRNRSNSKSPNRGNKACWYHKKYGSKAQKCISPCNKNAEKISKN